MLWNVGLTVSRTIPGAVRTFARERLVMGSVDPLHFCMEGRTFGS